MDVRRMLQERIETLSFKDAAKIADSYFDADGRPKHCPGTASINEVADGTSFDNDEASVNAIGRHVPQRQNRFPAPSSQRKPFTGSNRKQIHEKTNNVSRAQPTKREPNPKFPQKNVNLCSYHFKYGNDAKYCEVGCSRFDENRFPGNGTAGQK